MFKVSTDADKIFFGGKDNSSNTPNTQSQKCSRYQRQVIMCMLQCGKENQSMNEPVLRVSNDNGKTFGEKIILSAK